jgi:proteasome lid subunit RPN8/RPN11
MTVTPPLFMPVSLSREMTADALRAYPDECCGILFGQDGPRGRFVQRVQSAANVAVPGERSQRFSIDPLQLMHAERQAADARQTVIGFYHSHPDHPARPSEHDREQAWPFYSYLIVSILNGEAGDLTSWILDDQTRTFHRQDILGNESH